MKIVKSGLVFLVILFFVVQPMSATGQGEIVEDIEIRGYRSVSKEEIMKRIKTQTGKEFEPKQAYEDYKRVSEMRQFDRTQCTLTIGQGPRGGVVLIFLVKEG